MISFDNTFARLPDRLFSRQTPTRVPEPQLVRLNEPLAMELGLDPNWLRSEQGVAMLSGNGVAAGSDPLAQAYAGHQFGRFVPQLGDGRALLLGEVVDSFGRRRDIQLKGAGRTRFSRGGDGKAALGPVLREYLVSEAMHGLGVPTTRALAVVRSGEWIQRDSMLEGAIFTRVASSHLRVGTFQYFAARGDTEALGILTDYAIARHFPEAAGTKNPVLAFLSAVIAAQASLIPRWLGVGFIHGVMNTDNCAISGETIDFGPCAFMDIFHPKRVFSSIDRDGRYAWGNQPAIAEWNLTRLAETLIPLLAETETEGIALAEGALAAFWEQFADQYFRVFSAKLGVPFLVGSPHESVKTLVEDTLRLLAEQQVDFTSFFRLLTREVAGRQEAGLASLFTRQGPLDEWRNRWRELTNTAPQLDGMLSSNPVVIPRNHRIEQAIERAYRGDFELFHRLADRWCDPYEENQETADLEVPPLEREVVGQTYCGT